MVKSDVKKRFTTGTVILPSLTDLVNSLVANLSTVSNQTNRIHSIKERKFYGIARKLSIFGVKCLLFCFQTSGCSFFKLLYLFLEGGTFPTRTETVLRGPKTQKNNSFMVSSASPNSVLYRTISCPCVPCISGEIINCHHHPFVPKWEIKQIQFATIPEGISHV